MATEHPATDIPVTEIVVAGVTVDRIRRRMNRLPPALCDHCKRVEQIARELAELHGLDPDPVGIAALAHDAAKHFSPLELLLRVEEYPLPASEFEMQHARIMHGPVGAEMLRREDRLDDPSLYNAIYWHTTGNPSGGDDAGHIVFLADKLDPIKVSRYPWQSGAARVGRAGPHRGHDDVPVQERGANAGRGRNGAPGGHRGPQRSADGGPAIGDPPAVAPGALAYATCPRPAPAGREGSSTRIMAAQLQISPEAAKFIRAKGGQAVVDLLCWRG